ncbi:MAG: N4-gp56 family major capsid protein [Telluria sp.]
MWSPNLSKVLRMSVQPLTKFRQFADVKDAAVQGKGMGEAFHWNVYSDVATQGTTLTEGTAMPTTNFVITQGTMTITEAGNSVPYTSKLDDLSEQPVKDIISKVLKNDAKKAFDIMAEAQFRLTPLRVVATGGTSTSSVTLTTNGTATATNNVALGKNHIKAITDVMKERNIPPYIADDYIALAHPTTFRTVKNDLEAVHQYVDAGFQMILNGEIGRYEGVRFVEQTNIAKAGFTNGLSNWCYFFGNDTVAEGIVIPEEMRGAIPSDYGRQRGIAWYYLGGFGIVQTQAAQARILRWDSAA